VKHQVVERYSFPSFRHKLFCLSDTNYFVFSDTNFSKERKDWTRRVGNDRHLICIEDPFEISHDLGRVVDKFTIKILREEFERAANILQFDPNPSVTLFEPYVPPPSPSLLQEETANAAEIEL
jgi:hypothetical protein